MTTPEIVGWVLGVGGATATAAKLAWPLLKNAVAALKTIVEAAKDIKGEKREEDRPLRTVVETTASNVEVGFKLIHGRLDGHEKRWEDHERRLSLVERRQGNGEIPKTGDRRGIRE